MEYEAARRLTEGLADDMRPLCERVEIAGSIRRRRPQVKDIELVAVPLWRDEPEGLFGDAEPVNELYKWGCCVDRGRTVLRWLKGFKPTGKYWQGEFLSQGIKLDLFLTTREQWGLIFLIRTGSAEFSEAVVTHGKRIGKPSRDGHLWNGEERIPTPEEGDVFKALNLEYVQPEHRTGREVLRVAKGTVTR